jgi:hypothetical protein
MGTKSRETIYGASVRAAAERAAEARKAADRLAVEAWNKRMLAFQGIPNPTGTMTMTTITLRDKLAALDAERDLLRAQLAKAHHHKKPYEEMTTEEYRAALNKLGL